MNTNSSGHWAPFSRPQPQNDHLPYWPDRPNNRARRPAYQRSFPVYDRSLFPPNNAQILYYSLLGRLQSYLAQNLTRYREHFLRLGRVEEHEAISEEAVQHMTSQPICQNGGEIIARVFTLCDNYTRCKMPHSDAAVVTLMEWAWYLRDHFQNFTEESRAYEDFKRAQATSAADDLWKAYQAYTTDTLGWAKTWIEKQEYQTFQERQSVDNAAYMAWLQQNQPERLPPAPPAPLPFKFRAEVEEWHPATSGATRPAAMDSSEAILGPETTVTQPTSVARDSSHGRQAHRSPHNPFRATPLSVSPASSISEQPSDENDYSGQDTPGTEISVDDHLGSNRVRKNANTLKGESGNINQDILFVDAFRKYTPAAAIKDSGNQGPNYVSEVIVRRLGREADIKPCRENSYPPQQDLSGNQVQVVGEIQLDFMWWDRGNKDEYSIWHREVFVVAIMLDIQVLFGKDYLMKQGILFVNEPAMQRMILPLTPNIKITKELKEQRAEQERQQRIKKERAEARRRSLERRQAPATAQRSNNNAGARRPR